MTSGGGSDEVPDGLDEIELRCLSTGRQMWSIIEHHAIRSLLFGVDARTESPSCQDDEDEQDDQNDDENADAIAGLGL